MDEKLKEILEGDYKFVMIDGDYFDCPSCNDVTSFNATTYYDEKSLLEYMVKFAGRNRMEAIWLIDSDNGDMVKYCDIDTSTGFHNVSRMSFHLPEKGEVIILKGEHGFRLADDAEIILYGNKTGN